MKRRHTFAVVWFDPHFTVPGYRTFLCSNLAAAYAFVDGLEQACKDCGYQLRFWIRNAHRDDTHDISGIQSSRSNQVQAVPAGL